MEVVAVLEAPDRVEGSILPVDCTDEGKETGIPDLHTEPALVVGEVGTAHTVDPVLGIALEVVPHRMEAAAVADLAVVRNHHVLRLGGIGNS